MRLYTNGPQYASRILAYTCLKTVKGFYETAHCSHNARGNLKPSSILDVADFWLSRSYALAHPFIVVVFKIKTAGFFFYRLVSSRFKVLLELRSTLTWNEFKVADEQIISVLIAGGMFVCMFSALFVIVFRWKIKKKKQLVVFVESSLAKAN